MAQRVRLADPVLTPATVASLIGVHVDTVYKWVAKGDLPGIKISHKVLRIRATSLQQFLAARTRRGTEGASAS
jgi:excisionase family DNA binding protein